LAEAKARRPDAGEPREKKKDLRGLRDGAWALWAWAQDIVPLPSNARRSERLRAGMGVAEVRERCLFQGAREEISDR